MDSPRSWIVFCPQRESRVIAGIGNGIGNGNGKGRAAVDKLDLYFPSFKTQNMALAFHQIVMGL